jgi:hypothetical protein
MVPGVEDHRGVDVTAADVPGQRVVEGERVVDLVPADLAQSGKALSRRRLEETSSARGGLRVDQQLVDALVGRGAGQLARVRRGVLRDLAGGFQVLAGRDDRDGERDDRDGQGEQVLVRRPEPVHPPSPPVVQHHPEGPRSRMECP